MKSPVDIIAYSLPAWERHPNEAQCLDAARRIIKALKDEGYLIVNRKELNSYA